MRFFEKINRYARELGSWLPWTLPLKFVVGALLGALGGAGVLGFLSEYATYSYALYFGFRPPLEGIPYLKASVTLLSFVLLVGAAIAFIAPIVLLRQFRWQLIAPLEWAVKKWPSISILRLALDADHHLRGQPVRVKMALSLITGAVLTGSMYVAGKKDGLPPTDLIWLMLGSFIYGFLVMICTLSPNVIRPLGWLCTSAYFCVWLYLLFMPSTYGLFLRTVGYGGGLPVTVDVQEHPEAPVQSLSGFLLLRTTEAMMIFMPHSNVPDVVEVPRDRIRAIHHPAGSRRNLLYRMPE